MKIPRPTEKVAGCVWLPRILAKARLMSSGQLPPDYAANFCQPQRVDGTFLSHFGLSREDILNAAAIPDEEAAAWFRSRSSEAQVEQWNQIALNLGRPGYPLAERFATALKTTYQHIDSRGMTTVFEVLAADEKNA